MEKLFQFEGFIVALAVLLFVFLLVAILGLVDHKAKIPAGEKDDAFSVAGVRRDHPIWAWLVSGLLGVLIITVLTAVIYPMVEAAMRPEKETAFMEDLSKEQLDEKTKHFHNSPTKTPYTKGVQPICNTCHGEFPHSSKPMVRTLLNMHTQFLGCMTCHADPEKVPESDMKLRWLNYSGIEVTGPPFGTQYDSETGRLVETDDYFSKIVPYQVMPDGREVLLEITEESDQAKEFLKVREEMTPQQKIAMKKRFHKVVNPVGRFCTRCHAPEEKSYIPFRELGFSDKRVKALTNLNIVGIVQKYKKFYIPKIFDPGTEEEKREALVGEDVDVPQPTGEMKEDPRSWWRDTYESK